MHIYLIKIYSRGENRSGVVDKVVTATFMHLYAHVMVIGYAHIVFSELKNILGVQY